jgi:F-type H+-transporting ATPase subunit delta
MIELTPLARPYAKALFATALEDATLEEMANELQIMATASESKEVTSTIENPALSRQEVVTILVNLFEESVSETSKRLLAILADNKRLNLLQSIYSIYQELLAEHKEQNTVTVFVASEPSGAAREEIEQKLKSSYGNDANISFSKDPEMMGGLSIKVGDETLDLSIRGKVKKLVNQLNF